MNDAAFRQLILAEIDPVFRLAFHLTKNQQLAEDYVQETYLRALRSAATFTPAEFGARPWLFKILHHVICSGGAKSKRERSAIDDISQSSSTSVLPAQWSMESSAINWEDVDDRLKNAVADLPLTHRETFILSALEGLRYREIAEITEVPIGTVMSRLSRARKILAERLSDLASENRLHGGPGRTKVPPV